jgi:hypothetical protein
MAVISRIVANRDVTYKSLGIPTFNLGHKSLSFVLMQLVLLRLLPLSYHELVQYN